MTSFASVDYQQFTLQSTKPRTGLMSHRALCHEAPPHPMDQSEYKAAKRAGGRAGSGDLLSDVLRCGTALAFYIVFCCASEEPTYRASAVRWRFSDSNVADILLLCSSAPLAVLVPSLYDGNSGIQVCGVRACCQDSVHIQYAELLI